MATSGTRARQLDGVRVAELVRREAAVNPRRDRGVAKLGPRGGAGALAPTRRAGEDAERWADGQLHAQLEPELVVSALRGIPWRRFSAERRSRSRRDLRGRRTPGRGSRAYE
jgi:hypothetical protein